MIAGEAYGHTSPVQTFSPMIYLDVQMTVGGKFTLPGHYSEQAIYSVTPGLQINQVPLEQHRMAVLKTGVAIEVIADRPARCIGGWADTLIRSFHMINR